MSIALGVKWADGRFEFGPGATQRTAELWASIAGKLGLPMLSQIAFNGWPIFGPQELAAILTEFQTLRDQFADPGRHEQIDRIVAALNCLSECDGWVADFG